MSTWTDYLKQFDNEFKAVEDQVEFDELEDGKYPAKIDGACLKESKKGEPMVEFELLITSGKYKGRRDWKYHMLRAGNMKYLKWDLKTCGLNLDSITELPSRLREAIDKEVTLEIATKTGSNGKSYRSKYIKKYDAKVFAEKQSSTYVDMEPTTLSDDDLPF